MIENYIIHDSNCFSSILSCYLRQVCSDFADFMSQNRKIYMMTSGVIERGRGQGGVMLHLEAQSWGPIAEKGPPFLSKTKVLLVAVSQCRVTEEM